MVTFIMFLSFFKLVDNTSTTQYNMRQHECSTRQHEYNRRQREYKTTQNLFWFIYFIAVYSEPGILGSEALFML